MPDEQEQGPWTKYAAGTEQKPWEKYGAPPPAAAPAGRSVEFSKDETELPGATPRLREAVKTFGAQPETDFEKENKPNVAMEALRTAGKIPLKSVGLDTNAPTRSLTDNPSVNWMKANAQNAMDAANPARIGPPKMLSDVVHGMNDTSHEGEIIRRSGRSVEPAAANQPGAMQSRPGGPVFRLGDELEHPTAAAAMRTAASMLPVVGPGAVRAGHQIARATTPQEMGEGIAEGGGAAGQAFLASEPGQRFANAAIEKVGGPIARGGAAATRAVVKGTPPQAMVPEAPKAMTQAIQPGVNIPRAQESIQIAGPRMAQVARDSGVQIASEGEVPATEKALKVNYEAKRQILDAIDQRIGPVKDLRPDTLSVADAMEKSISKRTERQFPQVAARIRERAATYRQGDLSLADIEDSIIDANKSLRNFYKQPTSGENPTSADLDATLAEVVANRKLLDQKVGELGGNGAGDLAQLKREYGAQRDVERALARQHAISTRVKGASLWEGLAYLHAAGDLVSGNVLGAMRAASVLTMGKMLKNLRDPNFLLNQAFHGPKAFTPAEPIAPSAGPPKPAGLLSRPATEAGYTQEDTSGPVRGGRYTTPRAQLTDEQPIQAKFIREIPRQNVAQRAMKTTAGLLGNGELPPTNVPPIVDERFAQEPTGNGPADATRLGTKGEGGVIGGRKLLRPPRPPSPLSQPSPITRPKAGPLPMTEKPAAAEPAFTAQEMEEAELLAKQTRDMLASGDRPGRYFDQRDVGDVRTSFTKGGGAGTWRGVGSMRGMLPWLKDTGYTLSQLERGLREGGNAFLRDQILKSAAQFIRREKANGTTGEQPDVAEQAMKVAAQNYKPSEKATTMSGERKSLGPEFEAGEVSHEIARYKEILRNPKATIEERAMANARLIELGALR